MLYQGRVPSAYVPRGFGRNWGGTLPDVGALRALEIVRHNDLIAVAQIGGATRWYRFDDESVLADNDFSIIRPTSIPGSEPGRWELVTGEGVVVIAASNVIYVDDVSGDDSTGMRGLLGRPFKTVSAALAVAIPGDEVSILPGTYDEPAGFTVPNDVTVRGSNVQAVVISAVATGNLTLCTMGTNSRVEDLTLTLLSSGHHTLTGVRFPGTTAANAKLRTAVVRVDNSGAGAGTSQVCGVLIESTGVGSEKTDIVRSTTVDVISTGSGKKRAVLMQTSAGTASFRDVNLFVTGGTDSIGAEIDISGGSLFLDNCKVSGGTQDVKETDGELFIGPATALINVVANGSPFTTLRLGTLIVYAVSGGLPGNATRYFRPGTDPVSASEIKLRMPQKTILRSLSIRAIAGPGSTRTLTMTGRKNGADTAVAVTLVGSATSSQSSGVTADFGAGDDFSLKMVTETADATTDPVVVCEFY